MSDKQTSNVDMDLVMRRAAASRVRPIREGYLPLTEATFDLQGAASPFGEQNFPLPVSKLTYVPPSPDAFPQHL